MHARPASLPTRPGRLALLSIAMLTAAFTLTSWSTAWADRIPSDQAPLDGCGRTLDLLDYHQHQSWVYVGNTTAPVTLRGQVTETKISDEDLYAQHETRGGAFNYYINHDINIDVTPDSGYEYLLATGNTDDTLEVEAGNGLWAYQNHTSDWRDFYPLPAWTKINDRVDMIGPEVWDCGHYPPFNAGERTELHPPAWVHVDRAQPVGFEFTPGQPTIAKEHTIFGTSNKQKSGIIAQWEQTCSQGNCLDDQRQNPDVRGGTETFFLAAPPKPSPDARMKVRQVRFSVPHLNNAGTAQIQRVGDTGANVTINVPDSGAEDAGYAARWYVGWDRSTVGFKKMETKFLNVKCVNNLETFGDGEWQMQFRAYNSWYFKWDAGLNSCADGETVTLNPTPTLTTIVPDDQLLDLEVAGYDNDDPLPGQSIGTYRAQWPLANQTQTITGSPNYTATIKTTVLQQYPPVP